ncbi:carbonic anhydrase 5A, mitochondrial isoform X2 [Gymnodraco acuticeps]|uniref:Carbonic anhydrase n=1 Tax=Gymnodraco acuticeps TaxID=8218 RepID=A0A6P8TD32_GYMAC|nr:carbonic anhydrase 5A, mitochondrial isoform X2 [Gymnodraco acuticeps]
MVTLSSVIRPFASQLHRQLFRHANRHRITPVRRCNLAACSSKYVLSQMHPMWQEPLAIPGGDRQSPIDIVIRKSVYDSELKPLVTDYDPQTCQQIWNNGYSFLVEYDDTTDKSTVKGGPLQDKYRLCQFHFHWGESNAWGSEHTVDRKLFSAELHLVHWNSDKYSLFEEAVMEENGLAVIGVFLKVHTSHMERRHVSLDNLNSVVDFNRFDPACLLPSNTDDYWTYHGSLTTPPLTESVTWMVMKQHIEVSHDQLAVFRSLLFTAADEEVQKGMVNNFRVQQSQCGRTVRSSFSPFLQEAPSAEEGKH